jgi:hypothetical protein
VVQQPRGIRLESAICVEKQFNPWGPKRVFSFLAARAKAFLFVAPILIVAQNSVNKAMLAWKYSADTLIITSHDPPAAGFRSIAAYSSRQSRNESALIPALGMALQSGGPFANDSPPEWGRKQTVVGQLPLT